MTDQNKTALSTATMDLVKQVVEAANITKKNTKAIVVNCISLEQMDGLDLVLPIASRMANGMTTLERKAFKMFIDMHFPFIWDEEMGIYSQIDKDKTVKKGCKLARKLFLDDYDNNYWLWVSAKVKVDKKEVDWTQRFDSAFSSLMDSKKGGKSLDDVIKHIIEKQGITAETMMNILNTPVAVEEQEVPEQQEAA